MSAKERSRSIGVCRSCGETVKVPDVYCLSCATDQADRDAVYFDHWLVVFACLFVLIAIIIVVYSLL
jgi:hypothetical protein